MSKQNQAFSKLYAEQLESTVDADAQQNFSTALEQDPDLQQDYAEFGELIQLLNALPRPASDPDFAIKVQRRIARRQRSRRRSRRQQPALAMGMGAISTLITLLVVLAIALATHPLGLQVQSLAATDSNPASKTLFLNVQASIKALQAQLETLQSQQHILHWSQTSDGLKVAINSEQLAHFLQSASSLGALQINAQSNPPTSANSVKIQLQIKSLDLNKP